VRLLPLENKAKYTEPLTIREEKRILELVNQVAEARGSDMSTIYREAIRQFLAKLRLLNEEAMKFLEGT
jgi:predicted transcriptional regulator